jgi:DNA-binding NarL/FixJ family response regulator
MSKTRRPLVALDGSAPPSRIRSSGASQRSAVVPLWDDSYVGREVVASTLDSAHAAFERGEFDAARELYEAALAEERSADALDGLGQALWFLCDIDAGIARREEAYAQFRRAGDLGRAAEIALWLVVEHATSVGNEVAAGGLFKRAERLLAEAPLCAAHAELEVQRGQRCADPEEAKRHFERAVEIGKQLDDPDAEVRGLNQLGFLKVMLGDLEGGMALLDETMAAAMGGELRDPWAVGATCCSVLFACERISDLRRAAQWSRVVVEFTERRRYVPLSALCRSVYAGVLISSGDWERAEAEVRAALDAYRGFGRPLAAYPLARLADLRLRQGRFEEAEQLIAGWEGHPEMTTVAISLLIERGETSLASTMLEYQLKRLGDNGPLTAPLLPLLVRARLAEGDPKGARAAAERFMELAGSLGHLHLMALAELAAGQVSAVGEDEAAVAHLEAALEAFSQLGMPFEEGRTRVELAAALADREPELAIAEARAGLELLERLGAAREADRAAGLLRSLGAGGRRAPKRPGELTRREREVLALLERGLSNKQIAARLYITPKTASHHVSRILSKLGVRTRAEAAAVAARESAEKSAAK